MRYYGEREQKEIRPTRPDFFLFADRAYGATRLMRTWSVRPAASARAFLRNARMENISTSDVLPNTAVRTERTISKGLIVVVYIGVIKMPA